MPFNIALVVDPDWEVIFPPVSWSDPQYQTCARAQWFTRIRTGMSQISQTPADFILTLALPNNPLDALFGEPQPVTNNT